MKRTAIIAIIIVIVGVGATVSFGLYYQGTESSPPITGETEPEAEPSEGRSLTLEFEESMGIDGSP